MRYQPRNSTEHELSRKESALAAVALLVFGACFAALWSESATELCRMAVLLVK